MAVTGTDTDLAPAADHQPGTSDVPVTPETAADALFDDPKTPVAFVAADEDQARRAAERFARRFANAPGVFRDVLDGARAGAEALSVDRFQGLAEIVQNADDAGASRVSFGVAGDRLVAVHDGDPVTLSDVLALATPWLSNKRDDSVSTGRFGIGLMTLRALSDVIEIHSGVYHLRLGNPTISPIESNVPRGTPLDESATALCMPLRDESIDTEALVAWLDRWDDGALLFLRHVRTVSVVDSDGRAMRTLTLAWSEATTSSHIVDGRRFDVRQAQARSSDGRTWLVHTVEAPTPSHVRRLNKAAGSSVPLGVALPLQPESHGAIYAGLPVQATSVPVWVNAQFDPVTSRAGLASTAWNRALLPLIGDLWVSAVADLFLHRPRAAWAAVPLPDLTPDDTAGTPVRELELLLLERARVQLATTAAVRVDDTTVPLMDLAVEDEELEDVLDPGEIAALAGLTATLPGGARDSEGRWRLVLGDWRGAGAPLPATVTVSDSVPLLAQVDRTVERTIRLTAACLDAGLGGRLIELPCVVVATGEHVVPPAVGALHALVTVSSPLAEQLGLGMTLAVEHLAGTAAARTVLGWFREIGAVIEDPDDEQVVRRLAAAGQAGNCLEVMLTDEQLRMLRDAFEQLAPSERTALGASVGLAIRIAAHSYDPRGRRIAVAARPAEVYLSRAIDREPASFAVAAGHTPGLVWADGRYADQLRSSLGRGAGLGAQKFLGLLGAERAPRLVSHPALYQRYSSESRLGLPANTTGSPPQRAAELRALGATDTLDDLDSPDLHAVALGIGKERKALRRRERAAALLAVLARAWDRLRDQADVDAADGYHGWRVKGSTRAFWLWSIAAIAWLDDVGGVPRAPLELRVRTAGTVAVHGPDAPGYVRPEFDVAHRREVLAALGVAGEPSTGDLVSRLRQLRDSRLLAEPSATDAAIVYQALAERLASREFVPGDLTERNLRDAFANGAGLIHANLGWRTPADVLAGPPVFGARRAFVPQVPRTGPLWTALRVRNPSLDDCLQIVGELARTRRPPRDGDILIALETLRLLRDLLATTPFLPSKTSRRLGALSLHTSRGWTTKRPVYALDDPALVEGLRAELPVWEPGGEIAQFESLIGPLRVVRLGADAAKVIDPEAARREDDATELLTAAVSLLQDDLARNDPTVAGMLSIGWDQLRVFEVRATADLRVRVEGFVGRGAVEVEVASHVDVSRRVLFVRDKRLLRQVDGAGRAIAGLFTGADHRQLAQAWLAACIAADEGRIAQRLQLAAQQAADAQAAVEQQIIARTSALAEHIADRHNDRAQHRPIRPTNAPPANGKTFETPPRPTSEPAPPARTLVDPTTLKVVDINGRPATSPTSPRGATHNPSRGTSSLPQPDRNAGAPRSRTAAPGFTLIDKESVGLELARLVLAGDSTEVVDLRAQRGVGADAIDSLDRFFELKVHLGDEPDTIHLEQSQINRALTTPDFFLVVVSNVEGPNARPKVRIIADPLHQLAVSESSSIGFAGVRSAKHSLVYNLSADEDPTGPRTAG